MTSAPSITVPLVFIGGGNMANAIIRGGVAAGKLEPSLVVVAEPDATKHAAFAALSIRACTQASEALSLAGPTAAIVLCVKPQMLEVVAAEIGSLVGPRLVMTILAGTPSGNVQNRLGGLCRVVRVMPNLPASIGLGASAIAAGATASPEDVQLAMELFAAVGPCVERIDESLMDAFTAIAGSGPAYLFYLAEAMTESARQFGFSPDVADRIVRATLMGSASLLAVSHSDAAHLRAAVTSKGGTTNAATTVLDQANAMQLLASAFDAARKRGEELSQI